VPKSCSLSCCSFSSIKKVREARPFLFVIVSTWYISALFHAWDDLKVLYLYMNELFGESCLFVVLHV